MMSKQDITITINVNLARINADNLAEFLHEMIVDMMHIEAIVSYKIDVDGENQLPYVIGEE
jgi:hypothetical protein